METRFIEVALPTGMMKTFDYQLPETMHVTTGMRVKVSFGKRHLIGIALSEKNTSTLSIEKIKSIETVLDDHPIISPDILSLCEWASDYYQYPFGDLLFRSLPKRLREGKPAIIKKIIETSIKPSSPLVLNPAQQDALNQITASSGFMPYLLEGITGSGKTEIYLQAIAHILKQNQQALVLIPEIGLTPQTLTRFQHRFSEPIAILHSGLNEQQRLDAYLLAANGHARIIIGTRSALFTPLPDLGLIIVDEEHDGSFKQQDQCRYSARDLACVRAQQRNIPLILGSATPSMETLENAIKGRYQWLKLPARAGDALIPDIKVIDCKITKPQNGITKPLEQAISETLAAGNQVLIFINRRGYAPVSICSKCAWISECPHCDVPFTLHKAQRALICHHCDCRQPLFNECPTCKEGTMRSLGLGTEKCEHYLSEKFPEIPVLRIDKDSTRRKGQMETYLNHIHQGEPLILIGTQMLAKGHHFPHVTLVGIVDADTGFLSSDFRATEKMGQLLTQVSGRAGRAEKTGSVFIQTYQPDHPDLRLLLKQGYAAFAKQLLKQRQEAMWPPYAALAMIRCRSTSQEHPIQFLQTLKNNVSPELSATIKMMGPIPSIMEKKAGQYHAHLLIHAKNRKILQALMPRVIKSAETIKAPKQLHWSVDIDPLEIVQ